MIVKFRIVVLLLFEFLSLSCIGQTNNGYVNISIRIDKRDNFDSISVIVLSELYPHVEERYKLSFRNNNSVHLRMPVSSGAGYFYVATLKSLPDTFRNSQKIGELVPISLWEIGDSLKIYLRKTEKHSYKTANGYEINFSGKGSYKNIVKRLADSAYQSIPQNFGANDEKIKNGNLARAMKAIHAAMSVLNSEREKISLLAYNILKADYYFDNPYATFYKVLGFFRQNIMQKSESERQQYIDQFKLQIVHLVQESKIPDRVFVLSKNASDYVVKNLIASTIMESEDFEHLRGQNWDSIYFFIKRNFAGEVRDKLIYTLIDNPFGSPPGYVIDDAVKLVSHEPMRSKIIEFATNIVPGSTAYNFNLPDESGRKQTLSDFEGKFVLIDFWYTGCGACINYYRNFLQAIETKPDRYPNIRIISISVDASRQMWLTSLKSRRYTSEKVVNLFTEGKGSEHEIIRQYKVVLYPTVILIDEQGKVLRYNTPDLYKEDQFFDLIDSLQKAH